MAQIGNPAKAERLVHFGGSFVHFGGVAFDVRTRRSLHTPDWDTATIHHGVFHEIAIETSYMYVSLHLRKIHLNHHFAAPFVSECILNLSLHFATYIHLHLVI